MAWTHQMTGLLLLLAPLVSASGANSQNKETPVLTPNSMKFISMKAQNNPTFGEVRKHNMVPGIILTRLDNGNYVGSKSVNGLPPDGLIKMAINQIALNEPVYPLASPYVYSVLQGPPTTCDKSKKGSASCPNGYAPVDLYTGGNFGAQTAKSTTTITTTTTNGTTTKSTKQNNKSQADSDSGDTDSSPHNNSSDSNKKKQGSKKSGGNDDISNSGSDETSGKNQTGTTKNNRNGSQLIGSSEDLVDSPFN